MSDSEEEPCYFGTPLEPYDEDAFPKKRPITLEEQVAKDAQGRRRFHGAFTGGFSAGFFNTVGSLEGWTPAEFKSTRSDKAQNKHQKPEDFMDDEDMGEFGIAPQIVRATDDYSTSKKRKRKVFSDGPIPGEPVLETLLQAGNETVGYFLIKNMNHKHRSKNEKSGPKVYGCVMPKDLPTDEPEEYSEYQLHEIYKQYLASPKGNTYGLGYVGLDKTHIALFKPTSLKVRERNNKKLSISGQAFGVGAFEDDDEDIYVKDDMSRYDFELTSESANQKKDSSQKKEKAVFDIFIASKNKLTTIEKFPPPVIPSSFTGKYNVKKSRFEPLPEQNRVPERKSMDAQTRAKYLGEDYEEKTYTPSNQQHKQTTVAKSNESQTKQPTEVKTGENQNEGANNTPSTSWLNFDRFVSAQQDDDPTNMLEAVKPTEMTHGTKEMHAAVQMKMFGPLTRVTLSWQPNSFLCRRFNVPEPRLEELNAQRNKKRTKNLIFEYQKHSENNSLCKPGLSVQATPSSTEIQPNTSEVQETNSTPSVIKENVPESNADEQPASTSKSEELQSNTEETKEETSKEKVFDMTERVDVAKNMDLFKAIFLSSSESESEDEAEGKDEEKQRKEQMTASVLFEPLVPKIKPTKEGILSNIDFTKFRSSSNQEGAGEERKDEVDSKSETVIVDDNCYGPKLPNAVSSVKTVVVNDAVANNDKWVEKGKQKKHKKKHKKEKSRDKHKKKHKHKSKR